MTSTAARDAEPVACLAASVIDDALRRARGGDAAARLLDPDRLAPWAGVLGVEPGAVVRLARRALAP